MQELPLPLKQIHLESIDSTQDWMQRMWGTLSRDEMTVVIAKEQTKGRGRIKGREWISPKGNLYATFALFMDPTRHDSAHLGQVAALSLRQSILSQGLSGKSVRLKWPNDLLIDHKKVGGVLVETFHSSPHLVCLIGLGLNINQAPDLTQDRPQSTTALSHELKKNSLSDVSYKQAVDLTLNHLAQGLNLFIREGFSPFLHSYAAALLHNRGDLLTSMQGSKKIEGRFIGIDKAGSLVLEVNGQKQLFVAGEWNT